VRDTSTSTARDHVNLISLRGGGHSLAGTLSGLKGDPRLVLVDDHSIDVPPARNMLVVRNDDRPGVIGRIGTLLGEAGVNIADMAVGRSDEGASALMVVSTSDAVSDEVAASLRAADGVTSVNVLARD
jgi:D-3-phosphoglycerate dehydrogenase